MLSRRSFFDILAGAAAAAVAVDPDLAGWVRGARMWSIPKPLGETIHVVKPMRFLMAARDAEELVNRGYNFEAEFAAMRPRPKLFDTIQIRLPQQRFEPSVGWGSLVDPSFALATRIE